MIGTWIDGGCVEEGQVGQSLSVVLWPVVEGTAGSHQEWKSVRDQRFRSSEGIDLLDGSYVTLYQWKIGGIDEEGVVLVTRQGESEVGRHALRPEGWHQLVSLCSGMGGSSIGAAAANLTTKVSCDRSQLACEAMMRNSDTKVIQGDFGRIDVVRDIHLAKGDTRMWLECGFPCQPFSRLGDSLMFGDPRAQTLVKALQNAWLWQSLGVVLECVETVFANDDVGKLLDDLCQLMGFQRHERVLHLQDCWPCRRSRWWGVLCPANWAFSGIPAMPNTPWKQIRDIIPVWPLWPPAEEQQLRWTEEEVTKYGDKSYGNTKRTLELSGVAPTALHSVANHFSDCPCGCRTGPLSDGRLRRGGLHGIEITSASPEHFARHPHPQELGLLNGVTPAYQYGPCMRSALCLIGQIASPLQALWVFLQVKRGIDQNETELKEEGNLGGEESMYFQLYCEDLLESRKAFWPIGQEEDVGHCKLWTGDGAPIDFVFSPGTCVGEMIKAFDCMHDQPGLWLVEKGGQILPVSARLCDGDLLNLRCTHSLLIEPQQPEIQITVGYQGENRIYKLPIGSFLFECFRQTPEIMQIYNAYCPHTHEPVGWGTRSWHDREIELALPQHGRGGKHRHTLHQILADHELQSWQNELHARGDAPSLDEGLDDLIVHFAGKTLWKLAADPNICFIGPRKAHTWRSLDEQDVCQTMRQELADYDGDRIIVLFGADGHWALIDYQLLSGGSECAYVDGIPDRLADDAGWFGDKIHEAFGAGPLSFTSASCFCQEGGVNCGAVALLHLGWRLGLWDSFNQDEVEHWYRCLRWRGTSPVLVGSGPLDVPRNRDPLFEALSELLESKGVPPGKLQDRVQGAIQAFGRGKLDQAMRAKLPWQALKGLASSKPKPWMWVHYDELQNHIAAQGRDRWGAALDVPKSRRAKEPYRRRDLQKCEEILNPELLELPDGLFNDGDAPVEQIRFADVRSGATGVAFCKVEDAMPYVLEGKSISTEPLMLLVVGTFASDVKIPMCHQSVEVPAKYLGTGDPIVVRCMSLQLGDDAVLEVSTEAKEVSTMPTAVVRIHRYRDETSVPWEEINKRPIKLLSEQVGILQLCRQVNCKGECGHFHPAVEEVGVDSVILDLWSARWAKTDGSKCKAADAETWQVYIRCPESAAHPLQGLSGQNGVWFEPRQAEGPGPDQDYAVVWMQAGDLRTAQHLSKTLDNVVGIARLGKRFGLRTWAKYAEELHRQVCPGRPFLKGAITMIFRLEPLPIGTHRQSLAECLQDWGWNAKPMQAARGSSGRAWEVGATEDPPAGVLKLSTGYITVTKIKEFDGQKKEEKVIAPARALSHIRSEASSSTDTKVDPLTLNDPWSAFRKQSTTAPPPASGGQKSEGQTKIAEVEGRLQKGVREEIKVQLEAMNQTIEDADQITQKGIDDRFGQLECDLREVQAQGRRFEQMFVDAAQQAEHQSQRIACLENEVQRQGNVTEQIRVSVEGCGVALQRQESAVQQVTSEVVSLRNGINTTLEEFFGRQAAHIESLVGKGPADKRARFDRAQE